jgi:fission process protein 1
MASVLIPGFTINRLCFLTSKLLRRYSSMPTGRSKWTTTGVGLASIPVIVHPIDKSVDWLMDNSVRRYYDSR